jgi:hypothetical protein
MCLVRFRSSGLLAILIHLMLFFNKVTAPICSSDDKKLLTNRIKNMAFLAVSHAVMYSVLVDDRTTHCCRFKLYETGEPYIINTYPVVDLLVIGLPSQSESIYPCSPRSPFR